MKLYNVPRRSRIRVLAEPAVPPAAEGVAPLEELTFDHLDGMYSYCLRDDGTVVHLGASTEVELVQAN